MLSPSPLPRSPPEVWQVSEELPSNNVGSSKMLAPHILHKLIPLLGNTWIRSYPLLGAMVNRGTRHIRPRQDRK